MKAVLYNQQGYKQKLPIPVADWAVRTKNDRELRMYLVARALFSKQAGYFTKDQVTDLRLACMYINTKRTFDRHFQRTLKAGLFSFDGNKYHFTGMDHLAPMVYEVRGSSLSRWRKNASDVDSIFVMPQSAFVASLYLSSTAGIHAAKRAQERYAIRQEGKEAAGGSATKHAEDRQRFLRPKDSGKVAYSYFNMLQGPEVPVARQSRISRIGVQEKFIERHWHCNALVDAMNLRTYREVNAKLEYLIESGIVKSTSRLFKGKYGEHQGKIRCLEDVTTVWKSKHVEVFSTRRAFFSKHLAFLEDQIPDCFNDYPLSR